MNKIIALWTHPRSIPTAFERAMMERGDLNILHEPFSYLYYVEEGNGSIQQEHIEKNHPTTYQDIRALIYSLAEHQNIFFKDMCVHCYDQVIDDETFLSSLDNTFLIRDPSKAIASYYAMNPEVTLDEIGYEQSWQVFKRVGELKGETPVVIDADDLEDDPKGIGASYCEALKIKFIPESLYLEPGTSRK